MARKPIQPNLENATLAELETACGAAPYRGGHDRLMAIRALALNIPHAQVALLHQVAPRTLNNWIHRFNACGIDGLIDRPRSGRPRAIPPQENERLRDWIRRPHEVGVTHWTGKKFHGHLRQELDLDVGYRTVIRWLHDNHFRLKVPQPWPDRQDETLRQAFVERLRTWLADEQVDLWFTDETGIEGDPRPRRRWAERGRKARVAKNGDHIRMNVTGLVCPRTGQFYALEFSHSDVETFQAFLQHANRDVTLERPRNLLICDNASWHKSAGLDWGRFEPVYLPPYSPDLNPIERLWLRLKAEWFCDFIATDREALMLRLDQALQWLIARTDANQITCSIKKEL
jgi:transposase